MAIWVFQRERGAATAVAVITWVEGYYRQHRRRALFKLTLATSESSHCPTNLGTNGPAEHDRRQSDPGLALLRNRSRLDCSWAWSTVLGGVLTP